jgi:hypothetical protein
MPKEAGVASPTHLSEGKRMQSPRRRSLAAYVAADRHLNTCGRGAKTLTQMAAELGTTKSTVRRWLRRDHWELWMEHWASADEIWEAIQDQLRKTLRDREERRLLGGRHREMLVADLDRCLAELTTEIGMTA